MFKPNKINITIFILVWYQNNLVFQQQLYLINKMYAIYLNPMYWIGCTYLTNALVPAYTSHFFINSEEKENCS